MIRPNSGSHTCLIECSKRVFLVEFFPGATRRCPVADSIWRFGLSDRDSGGRERYHFFANFSETEHDLVK